MAGGSTLTLAGHGAHSMQDIEVLVLTLAPGSASPIHSHPNVTITSLFPSVCG